MTKNNTVTIAFDDLTEFYAIQPDIEVMIRRKIPVKILVVPAYSKKMYEDTKNTITKFGYDMISENSSKLDCKILLEPYPLVSDVTAEFRIRYEYGVTPASVKPNPVYTPEWNLPYDARICYSPIAENIVSAYTKPYIIRPLQFSNFKRHVKGQKTNLLILLTWGDVLAVQKLARIKKQLGEAYNLIIKPHHAVQYRTDHKGIVDELKSIADEYYDATTNVNRLFEKADIVLTDNSSAVFEAIYLGIPAAIFSKATSDYYNLNGLKAAHFSLLIEPKRIPYTNKLEDVKKVIELAPQNISQQNKLKDELYPSGVTQTLTDVVEKYQRLNRKTEPYYIIRDLLIERKEATETALLEQAQTIESLSHENEALKIQLASFLGVKRSAKLLSGNLKRKVKRSIK